MFEETVGAWAVRIEFKFQLVLGRKGHNAVGSDRSILDSRVASN